MSIKPITRFNSKSLALITFFMLGLSLSSCGEDSSIANKKLIEDPFVTRTVVELTDEKKSLYQQYKLTEQGYQAVLKKLKETQKEVEKQGGKFTYALTSYDANNHIAIINDIVAEYDLSAVTGFPIKYFKDSKTLKVNWYDEKNSLPYYLKASILDVLIPSETYLESQNGKDYSQFLTKLALDPKKINNWSDIAYEFDAKTGQLAIAINDDLNKIFTLRLVIKLDGFSKQIFTMLGSDAAAKNPGMLLGMLSGLRLEQVYIKMELERSIDELIAALPEENAIEARKNYAKNKNLSDEEIKKQTGGAFTLEQVKQYRVAWFNFLEQKKTVHISIHPKIPQAFTALFSGFMMAQQSPRMAAGIIKQLNITVLN
ncbi:MAG: hypothetical protein QM479_06485 [Pseudomonadota bacterium]